MHHGSWDGWYWNGWHMGWMGLWWLIVLAAIVGVTWWVVASRSRLPPAGDDPETILKRRYANGELSHEEFQRRLAELRARPPQPAT